MPKNWIVYDFRLVYLKKIGSMKVTVIYSVDEMGRGEFIMPTARKKRTRSDLTLKETLRYYYRIRRQSQC